MNNQSSKKPMHLKIVDRLNLRETEPPNIPDREDDYFKKLYTEFKGMQAEINSLRIENSILKAGLTGFKVHS